MQRPWPGLFQWKIPNRFLLSGMTGAEPPHRIFLLLTVRMNRSTVRTGSWSQTPTQLHQSVDGFDEMVTQGDADFASSGLVRSALIRLAFLQAIPLRKIMGRIGFVSPERHHRLLANLSRHLTPQP